MQKDKNQIYLEGLLSGKEKIILKIYEKNFSNIVSYIKSNNGTYEDAEEIFHTALFQLTARVKVRNFEIKSSFEGYLYVVCKNLWMKELSFRKKRVRNEQILELNNKETDNSNFILEQERWELFEEKIALLSENCKKLLKAYFKKTPYSEIVEKFNYASENVAFQRVFKCKKSLAALVKKDTRYTNLAK